MIEVHSHDHTDHMCFPSSFALILTVSNKVAAMNRVTNRLSCIDDERAKEGKGGLGDMVWCGGSGIIYGACGVCAVGFSCL